MSNRSRQLAAAVACAVALGAGAGAALGEGQVVLPAPVATTNTAPRAVPVSTTTTLPVDPRLLAVATPSGLVRVLDDLATRQRELTARVSSLAASLGAMENLQPSTQGRIDQMLAQETELAARVAAAPDQERRRNAQRELEAAHLRAVTQGAALAPTVGVAEVERLRQGLADARAQLTQVTATLTAVARSEQLVPVGTQGVRPGPLALADVPAEYLALYQRAAPTCPGLSWTVLAAIGSIESDHGRSPLAGVRSGTNIAGAMGPMQFLSGTWAAYRADGDGDGVADVYRAADAVFGAVKYLCASGAGQPALLRDAIWAYNHADWYVNQVIDLAIRYGSSGLDAPSPGVTPAEVVANPRIVLSPAARVDILSGTVDRRLLNLLAGAASRHRIEVSVVRTGHSQFVRGTDRVSDHFYARAVDITAVDGAAVSATNRAAFDLAIEILTSSPSLRPDQLGSPWLELTAFAGAFSDDDHSGHIHVGWRLI